MKWIGGSRDAEIDLQAADCGLHASGVAAMLKSIATYMQLSGKVLHDMDRW